MHQPAGVSRRRMWPVLATVIALAAVAVLWTGLWFYAAGKAQATIAGWREREGKVGRTYACERETVGGFPLRIEARCADPVVTLEREVPPIALKAGGIVVLAQIFQPTWLIAQLSGPMTFAHSGETARYEATWITAEATGRGTPLAPEGVSIVLDRPRVEDLNGG